MPWLLLRLLLLGATGLALWAMRPEPPAAPTATAPAAAAPAPAADYVANAQCLSCHQDAAKSMRGVAAPRRMPPP